MPASLAFNAETSPQTQSKPRLSSFDSEQEFSLEHFLEVRRLVAMAEREDRELKGYVFDDSLVGANS